MKFAVVLPVLSLSLQLATSAAVDFKKDIQPIFEKRCIECHGSEKQKADLRLDSKGEAIKSDTKTIVPGKPDDSEMFKRVSLPEGHDDIMPPKGDPLTKEQVELIKKWIGEGAEWPEGLVLGGEAPKTDEPASATSTASATGPAKKGRKKAPGQEFANLKLPQDTAKEKEAIEKLAAFGISVRPIAQNLPWKEATIRPQDTNKTSEAIALLKDIPSLVDLNMAKLNLKDADLKNISELTNLQRLHIENNPVTDDGLAHIKDLINLEYLNLYNTQVTDESVDTLKGLTNLTALYLWQTKVTDEGAEKLTTALPDTMINRGEELKLLAKAELKKAEEKKEADKKDEEKKAEGAKKADEKKPEEKKAEEKKADDKKPEEKKPDDKKA